MNNTLDATSPEYWKNKYENESNVQLKEIYKDVYEKTKRGDFSNNIDFENLTDDEIKRQLEKAEDLLRKPAPKLPELPKWQQKIIDSELKKYRERKTQSKWQIFVSELIEKIIIHMIIICIFLVVIFLLWIF